MAETNVRKLYRSGTDRMIGGVCGGLAEYFSVDSTIIRIALVLLSVMNIVGVIVYFVCRVLIPENPAHKTLPEYKQRRPADTGLIIGIALVAIGFSFLFKRSMGFHFGWGYPFWLIRWEHFWPILLIIFGVWYIIHNTQKNRPEAEKMKDRRFFRSKTERMFGGVCSGLAKYWNVDVTLVRIGYAILTILTSFVAGIVVYIIIMIAVPEEAEFRDSSHPVHT